MAWNALVKAARSVCSYFSKRRGLTLRRTLPILILAMFLAAVTGVAGCGGSSDESDGTAASENATAADDSGESGSEGSSDDDGASGASVETSSLSKEEYVKRASAACAKRRGRILPEMAAYLGPGQTKEFTPDQFGPVFREVVLPAFEDELEIIRSLGAPEGDEEEIEAIVAAQEVAVEEAKKLKNPESFEEVGKQFAAPSETMREYGFTGCVNE